MYIRPRRLTPPQTRTFGAGLIVVGAVLTWQVLLDARGGDLSGRFAALAPPALFVGAWLLFTGTMGAPTLPQSPLWHRGVACALGVIGFVWGIAGFAPALVAWLGP